MTVQTARPLPECRLCTTPTRRQTYLANGGLCTACTAGAARNTAAAQLALLPDPEELA